MEKVAKRGGVVLLVLLAVLLLSFPVKAQESDAVAAPDSILVFYYPPGIRMFKTKYAENTRSLHVLREKLRGFKRGKNVLYVDGYSGSCKRDASNRRMAFRRCNNLKGYLIDNLGLRERDFKTVNHPFAHPALGEVVTIGFSPSAAVSVPVDSLISDEGLSANNLSENSLSNDNLYDNGEKETPAVTSTDVEIREPESPKEEKSHMCAVEDAGTEKAVRPVRVKTNILAWGAAIINFAADFQLSRHISMELPVMWSPWNISSRHSLKVIALQPECRGWLGKPGRGHFAGIHASVAWYNLRNGDDRYQWCGRPLLGAGMSYGYALQLWGCLGLEFTIGAGWANMRSNHYYNIADGAMIDRSVTNYFGIDRIGISVCYDIPLKGGRR